MDTIKPVLHILVVGFHHKKGCQVEFSYPPIIPGTEGKNECPSGWKYLPTLALPDGSHNFSEDSVFFNLPSLTEPQESVYGVSCYRQIPVEKLKIRTADVTRSTVQKSVCALISTPIYGYIEVKLSLIAHAFFEQGDFDSVEILIKAYEQLNACLINSADSLIDSNPIRQYFVGLPLRELILKWRHKMLILFKLMLLQKRVVCYGSPVRPICSLILGIVSLHPEIFNKGFRQVACVKTSRPMSPMPNFGTPVEDNKIPIHAESNEKLVDIITKQDENITESTEEFVEEETTDTKENIPANQLEKTEKDKHVLTRDASVDTIASNFSSLCAITSTAWNAPVQIFHSGNLCLPYLSLPYIDLLSDPSVLGYIIGASNVLFQQKKQLADVLIDVENAIVEAHDPELRKQLQLSTEDLRFVDFIIRNVQNPKEDAEGSEVWIREQFSGYMVAMLKSSLCPDGSKDIEHFNVNFMTSWKKTQCYQDWFDLKIDNKNFDNLIVGHPFAGNLSVGDMKLRIAQSMQNSESGRKLNHAVNRTSSAVGGAINTAKGALSTWWTSITTPQAMTALAAQQTQSNNSQNNNIDIDCDVSDTQNVDVENGTDANRCEDYPDLDEITEMEINSDNSQSDDNKNVVVNNIRSDTNIPVVTVHADDLNMTKQSNDIIEIGKEAKLLDKKHKIFTV